MSDNSAHSHPRLVAIDASPKMKKRRGGHAANTAASGRGPRSGHGEHGHAVSDEHAKSRPGGDLDGRREARAEGDRRELRLVAHLGEEEDHGRGQQRAPPTALGRGLGAIGDERPHAKGEEAQTEEPAEHGGIDSRPSPDADGGGQGVVEHGRDEDPEHDGPRTPVSQPQRQRDELRLVAHLRERDHHERAEERHHRGARISGVIVCT